MPTIVDLQHAEQGTTLRIPFVTLLSGSPTDPTTEPFSIEIFEGQDETGVLTETLTSVKDATGKFHVDWDIPRAQPVGFYATFVNEEVDTGPSVVFTDRIRFEVHAEGTFTPSTSAAEVVSDTATAVAQISKARDIDTMVQLVRMILRDHPQLNRLTTGRETGDGEILAYINLVISEYNSTPPPIARVSFFTFPSISYMIVGVIGWALSSSLLLRARNHLQYTDSGVSVDTENMAGYMQLSNVWLNAYKQWVGDFKRSKNLSDAYGSSPTGIHSEYFLLASLLGDSSYGGAGVLLQ